jgi:hypothetical protein
MKVQIASCSKEIAKGKLNFRTKISRAQNKSAVVVSFLQAEFMVDVSGIFSAYFTTLPDISLTISFL